MTRRRCRTTLLAALIGFVLLEAGLAVKVLRDPLLRRDDAWQRKLRRHRQRMKDDPTPFVVAQVGSSRTAVGLCGEEAEPLLSRHLGRPTFVFNLGQSGAGPITTLLSVRRLLDDGVRPDLLLIEVFPPLLTEQQGQEEALGVSAAHLTPNDVVLLSRYAHRERPWLAAEWLSEQAVPASTHRLALLTEAMPLLLRAQQRRDRFRQMRPSGWVPERPPPLEAQRRRAATLGDYGVWLRDFRPSPRLLAVVEETIELAQSEGIRVGLVLMPEGPAFRALYPAAGWAEAYASLERLAKRREVSLIDLRECLDEEDFFDSHHPYPCGARKAARALAERLTAPTPRPGAAAPGY